MGKLLGTGRIADGEGRVVTGRFVTRDVANVVRITLANGTEIRATDVHPVWSVDREDWVPAGKLEPGEHVDTLSGPVAVASVEPLDRHPAVYNLEVHGEHVYRIAVDGVLVHNAGPGTYVASALLNHGSIINVLLSFLLLTEPIWFLIAFIILCNRSEIDQLQHWLSGLQQLVVCLVAK